MVRQVVTVDDRAETVAVEQRNAGRPIFLRRIDGGQQLFDRQLLQFVEVIGLQLDLGQDRVGDLRRALFAAMRMPAPLITIARWNSPLPRALQAGH